MDKLCLSLKSEGRPKLTPKEVLKKFISKTGMTQIATAKILGFTPEYISYILNDKKFPRNPDFFVSAVEFTLAKLEEENDGNSGTVSD